ncbi:DM13 domain-containing protein [Candidatus Saccharibacteria bacterium]|nr:DM13 domain-containing protein [Candidatus Saccharibacteria bacterium]
MSKKRTKIVILTVFATLLLGGAAVYVVRNINEKPPIVVKQAVENIAVSGSSPERASTVVSATFDGVDTIHWGRGGIEILTTQNKATLLFKDDFEVAQGPDLFVYLSPNAAGDDLGEYASLGKLKESKGAQQYTLPDNYKDYKIVIIWCRALGVTFATAPLQ